MYYGEKIRIRGLELQDAKTFIADWNNYRMRLYLNRATPHSLEEEEEWIRQTWTARAKGTEFNFAAETLDGTWLGTTGITISMPHHRSGVFGIAIHNQKQWGKGYGTDITRTMLGIAFKILNLHRVELEVFAKNEYALRAYKNAGYKEVGRRRAAAFINGEYVDSIIMDILDHEFTELYPDFSLLPRE